MLCLLYYFAVCDAVKFLRYLVFMWGIILICSSRCNNLSEKIIEILLKYSSSSLYVQYFVDYCSCID